MGFVKSPEEIARIQRALSHPRFVNGEMLSVEFLTDEAVVAILTRATFQTKATVAREGSATLAPRGTVHDPLDELPVRTILRGMFLESDLIASCEAVDTTPADVFEPYHDGRHDDWSALDTESARVLAVS